jgi:hypothetical protein
VRDLDEILREISELSAIQRASIYSHLDATLTKREKAIALLDRLGKKQHGRWGEDAQAYVNRLRADDRF